MGVSIVSDQKLGRAFKPVVGLIPSGIVTVGAFSSTAQTYTNPQTIYWDSGLFNTQGQRWQAVTPGVSSDGCRNAATNRTSGGVQLNHVTEFEFLYTGQAADIYFLGGSYYDCQVYVTRGRETYKATVAPVTGSTSGLMHLPITFAASFHGAIRVHLGGGILIGIKTEQSAIVKPSPNRDIAILDGGEYTDGLGVKHGSGTSYLTGGLADFLFEKTGIVHLRRGQSPTGFFTNGSTTVSNDAAASDGSTRFFSADRNALLAADIANKPLYYLLVGSLADGGRSNSVGSSTGPMALREIACLQWLRTQDEYCTIAHVSPSPFTGAGAAGAVNGPPTSGSPHDLNRQEQALAIAATPRAVYFNAFGPTNPWFTGTGSNGSPAGSAQATLIGSNGSDLNFLGAEYMAGLIANALADSPVNLARVRGRL